MIMLTCPYTQQALKFLTTATVLSIENPGAFATSVSQLIAQSAGEDGPWLLSRDFSPVGFSTLAQVVPQVCAIPWHNKRLTQAIARQVGQVAAANLPRAAPLLQGLQQYGFWLGAQLPCQLQPTGLQTPQDLAKALAFAPVPPAGDLASQLADYMALCSQLLGTRVFVFFHLKSYLPPSRLLQLYHQAQCLQLHLLLLEPAALPPVSPYEQVYILDRDLCLIT